jgi:hypothetical protein
MIATYVPATSDGMSGKRDPQSFNWKSQSLGRVILLGKVELLSQNDLETFFQEMYAVVVAVNTEIKSIQNTLDGEVEADKTQLNKALTKKRFAKAFLGMCTNVLDRRKAQIKEEKKAKAAIAREKERLAEKELTAAKRELAKEANEQKRLNHQARMAEIQVRKTEKEIELAKTKEKIKERSSARVIRESVNFWINNSFSRIVKEEVGAARYQELRTQAFEMAAIELEKMLNGRPPSVEERQAIEFLSEQIERPSQDDQSEASLSSR